MSLNYFKHTSRNVLITPSEDPNPPTNSILNSDGLENFNQNYTNFGVNCGDFYVSEYKEGGILLPSLIIEFESSYD